MILAARLTRSTPVRRGLWRQPDDESFSGRKVGTPRFGLTLMARSPITQLPPSRRQPFMAAHGSRNTRNNGDSPTQPAPTIPRPGRGCNGEEDAAPHTHRMPPRRFRGGTACRMRPLGPSHPWRPLCTWPFQIARAGPRWSWQPRLPEPDAGFPSQGLLLSGPPVGPPGRRSPCATPPSGHRPRRSAAWATSRPGRARTGRPRMPPR